MNTSKRIISFIVGNIIERYLAEFELIRIYWNLHKDCYSIQRKVNGKWKTVYHTRDIICLKNVTLPVSAKVREKVREQKKKFVHAYVQGNVRYMLNGNTMDNSLVDLSNKTITYNPYKHDSFVIKETEQPIKKSDYALLTVEVTLDGLTKQKVKPYVIV